MKTRKAPWLESVSGDTGLAVGDWCQSGPRDSSRGTWQQQGTNCKHMAWGRPAVSFRNKLEPYLAAMAPILHFFFRWAWQGGTGFCHCFDKTSHCWCHCCLQHQGFKGWTLLCKVNWGSHFWMWQVMYGPERGKYQGTCDGSCRPLPLGRYL